VGGGHVFTPEGRGLVDRSEVVAQHPERKRIDEREREKEREQGAWVRRAWGEWVGEEKAL
jgi:hypothetical protein